jgi:hypothetical protein
MLLIKMKNLIIKWIHTHAKTAILLGIVVALFFIAAPKASAQLFYDAEIKTVFEDNVAGQLSESRGNTNAGSMGAGRSGRNSGSQLSSRGDVAIDLLADIGGSKKISEKTALFLMGSMENMSYSYYTEFDSLMGGLSGGTSTNLSNTVILRGAAFTRLKKYYNDSERSGSSYGGNLSLKEQLNAKFFLRESYEFEDYRADSPVFTYVGNSIGILGGFRATKDITIYLGYNFLLQKFDEPAGSTVETNTISLALEKKLKKNWFFDAGLNSVVSYASDPSTSATDNIFSVGLRYSY